MPERLPNSSHMLLGPMGSLDVPHALEEGARSSGRGALHYLLWCKAQAAGGHC